MDSIRISGGRRLSGRVRADGAKNAALPALAASLLTDQPLDLRGLPLVQDIRTMVRILQHLGGQAELGDDPAGGSSCLVRSDDETTHELPYEIVKTMRASAMLLGPILARRGRARVSLPGGCAIGARPMDLHVTALEALGAELAVEHGYIVGEVPGGRLRGARHHFPKVTVTGTENLMMAATLAEGTTELTGCAREPEVVDLARLLTKMGAKIEGAGTDCVRIEGVGELHGAEHRVLPDRIVAGTYLVAAAMAGDDVTVEDIVPGDLTALLGVLQDVGVDVEVDATSVRILRNGPRKAVSVRTEPHPGFPTDMQAQYMALATQVEGLTVIEETIFENRFMHVAELDRMGADIRVSGHSAVVHGRTPLSGAQVMATDLRASACLVLAGLVADGETTVGRVYHLDRGYEHIEEKLRGLGAEVERISDRRVETTA
ncbi:MAG: UDP-N-acetylglucosamine 1-carboxyvinyltransferase [Acidobacteriota bacterium]